MNVCVCSSATHFLECLDRRCASWRRSEESNNGACLGGSRQVFTSLGQLNCLDCRVVSLEHSVGVLRRVVCNTHVTFLTRGRDENRFILAVWVQGAEAFRVIASINGINESQVSEIIDINSVL